VACPCLRFELWTLRRRSGRGQLTSIRRHVFQVGRGQYSRRCMTVLCVIQSFRWLSDSKQSRLEQDNRSVSGQSNFAMPELANSCQFIPFQGGISLLHPVYHDAYLGYPMQKVEDRQARTDTLSLPVTLLPKQPTSRSQTSPVGGNLHRDSMLTSLLQGTTI
jgi:hypothetical protein